MSREIDERIVAMYFDNRNFEKGAQQTIQTLDELKKGMNFEGLSKGSKSFTDLSKKLNLEKVQKGAEKLKTTFGGVGDAIKKAFNLGPIDNVFHALDNFKNKYFDRVLGFDIAQKLASSLENTFRNLTIAPISAGWSQYENTMDSVKTIMSSTGESIDTVKAKLNEMTEYANKTIYSLNDMTSNLGKFTNNGVKLDDATNAMIGLANAAADAGQGAQQASMAMYNVSQAIGVGKMLSIDWKSLENANIATVKLKQTLIDSAVAAGTLDKKMVKNAKTGKEEVQYWTKAEKGAKAAQVTVEGFRDSLSKGWLDKQALLNTFAIYSGQLNATEIAALGFSREEAERLAKIGEEAMKAAQEVRTFSKMMDALREGVQSTWATSFEYIFGDMQEGTNLWTKLNKLIEDTLNKGAENRNNILMSWRGMAKDENGNVRNIQKMYDAEMELAKKVLEDRKASIHDTPVTIGGRKATAEEIAAAQKAAAEAIQKAEEQYAATVEKINKKFEKYGDPSTWVDYRDVAINALLGVEDAEGNLIKRGLFQDIQEIAKTVKDAFSDVFGVFDDQSLINIAKGLSEFADKFTAWLGDASDSESRLSKIRSGLTGVFSVLKIGYEVFKSLVSVGIESIKPLIDPLLNLFSKFGKWLNLKDAKNLSDIIKTLSDRFDKLWKKLTTLGWRGVFDKIGNWLKELAQKVRDSINTWLTENGLGGVVDWFVQLGDSIKTGFHKAKEVLDRLGISGFFQSLYDSIASVFKGKSLKDFLPKDYSGNVDLGNRPKVSIEMVAKAGWVDEDGNPLGGDYATVLTNTFSVGDRSKGFDFEYKENAVINITPILPDGKVLSPAELEEYLYGLTEESNKTGKSIKELDAEKLGLLLSYDVVPEGMSLDEAYEIAGKWAEELHKMQEEWDKAGRKETKAPIVTFLENVASEISRIWGIVENWEGWNAIGKFFGDIWGWIAEKAGVVINWFTTQDDTGKTGFVSFIENVASEISRIWGVVVNWEGWDAIGKFFGDIWGWIAEKAGVAINWFTTQDDTGKTGFVSFIENVASEISRIWGVVVNWEGWDAIGKFFGDIWGWIAEKAGVVINWFTTQDDTGKTGFVAFLDNVASEISRIWGIIENWSGWKDIGDFFINTWNWIANKAGGESGTVDSVQAEQSEEKVGFVTRILNALTGLIDSAKAWLKESGTEAIVTRFMDSVTKLLEVVAVVMEHIISMLHKMVGPGENTVDRIQAWTEFLEILGGILFVKWIQGRTTHDLAKISENTTGIGETMLQMAGAIALISLAVSIMGNMDLGKLSQGVGGVLLIAGAIFFVTQQLTKYAQAKPGDEPKKAWERVVGKLISWAGTAIMLGTLVDALPGIIDALSKAKKESGLLGSDVLDTFKGLILTLGGTMVALALASRIAPSGIDPKAALKSIVSVLEVLGITAVALFGTGGLIALIGENDVTENMRRVAEFLEGLGDAINGLFRGLFGVKHFEDVRDNQQQKNMEMARTFLSDLMGMTDSVENSKLVTLMGLMETLTDLTKMAGDIDTTNLYKLSEASEYVTKTLSNLIKLFSGGTIVNWKSDNIMEEIQPLADREQWLRIQEGFEKAKEIFDVLKDYGLMGGALPNQDRLKQLADGTYVDTIIKGINNVIDRAGDLHDGSGIQFDGFAIVKRFYESVADIWNSSDTNPDLPKFNGTPIVNAILDSLIVGDEAIKIAVKNMVQDGINLLGKESANGNIFTYTSIFGEGGIDLSQFGLVFPKVDELLDGMGVTDGKIEEVAGKAQKKIDETTGSMSGLKFAIAGISLEDSNGDGVPDIIDSIKSELESLQTTLDTDDAYTISIRPILKMDGLPTDVQKLQTIFDTMPLTLNSSFSFGTQRLPIEDTNIVTELQLLRTEVANARLFIQSAVNNMGLSVGNKITGLGSDIRQMKFYLDTKVLVGGILGGVDQGLGNRANLFGSTGVLPVRVP